MRRTAPVIALTALLLLFALPGCGRKETPVSTAPGTQPAAHDASAPVATAPVTPEPQTQPQNKGEEVDVVIAVSKADAMAKNPNIGDLEVLSVKIINDWARVDMQPADRSTDRASWVLRKIGDDWTVMGYGTAVNRSDYVNAPPELFD